MGIQSLNAQVTSIFLSYRGSPMPTWTEESRELTLDVARPSHEEPLTLEYRVLAGTAEAGSDFVAHSGTLHFAPFQQFLTLKVQLLDDREFEGNEQFYIELFDPVPLQPITTPKTAIMIVDDEFGYAPEYTAKAAENAGFFEIPIYRRGDINFDSSVEVFIQPGTARPGTDYVDETFTVNFASNQAVQTIRVRLINNSNEDGDRWFQVGLRYPTGGIPIGLPLSSPMMIEDNELGYRFRASAEGSELDLYEGGPEWLILERRGDYDIHSVAIVKVSPARTDAANWWLTPPAEAGADFIGSEFRVEFAPGQSSAEVLLIIVNDELAESREWILLQHTTRVNDPAMAEQQASIRDNEFNPLPVTPFCLGKEILPLFLIPLRDGKFLAATGFESGTVFEYQVFRFLKDGGLDADFTPMVCNGRPMKVVEGLDGKYTVRVWRDIEEGLIRFKSNGKVDATFNPITQRAIHDFEVTSNGQVYVTGPLRRLKVDGSVDLTFAPPELSGGENILLDLAENVYVKGDFIWHRLTPAGEVDSSFSVSSTSSLYEIGGLLYTWDSGVVQRVTSTGSADPGFKPVAGAMVEPGHDGKLFAFRSVGSEVSVERLNSDGTLDTTYMRGTLDVPFDKIWYAMEKDGRGFLVYNWLGVASMNGAPMYCNSTTKVVARIDLDIPLQRALVEPCKNNLLERETVEAKALTVIRTGANQSEASVRYRVRPGTALAGEHYLIQAEGDLLFEPGSSRALIPITILDNSKAEMDLKFFLDLLNENGSIQSSSELIIRNDDVGIQVVERQGNRWRIRPISGEFPNFLLRRSVDLHNWEIFSGAVGGVPFDLVISGEIGFVSGYAY